MSAAPLLFQACSVLRLTLHRGPVGTAGFVEHWLSEHVVYDMSRSRFVNMANADKVWSHLHSRDSTFPWEDFLDRSCLSLPSALDLSRPEHVAEPAPVAQIHAKKPRLETFSVAGSVALKVCVKPWHDEDRRGTALFQLQSIVVAWPEGFGIVRLCSLDSQELDLDELSYSIASACSHKATGTIVRRLASLTHFAQWASHTNLCPFPVSERVAWSTLAHLDKTEAAWSKPSGFTQSVNWCRGVLDLCVEDDFLSSPRVAGICKGFQARAPPPKRAPALTFAEVRFIEVLAASGQNCQDVVCAGAVLFMLFACARASDAARTTWQPMAPQNITAWLRAVLAAEFPESRRLSSPRLQALAGRRPPGFRWKLAGCLPITCTTVPAAQRRTAETFSLPRPGSLRKCCWP